MAWYNKQYKLLLGTFMPTNKTSFVAGTPTNELIAYYLWNYIDSGGLPEWSKVDVLWGDWPFNKDVERIILLVTNGDSNFPDKKDSASVKIDYFNHTINKCRFLFLKDSIMEYDSDWIEKNVLDWDWDDLLEDQEDTSMSWITNIEVQQLITNCISIKAWDDNRVRENQRILAIYLYLTKQTNLIKSWRDIDMSSYKVVQNDFEGIDTLDETLAHTDEFQELEKLAFKAVVHEDYHEYIDMMNLTELKKSLTDFKGRSFVPRWWQLEFLAWHKRFNSIAWSRRVGKTIMAAYLIIRQIMLPNQVVAVIVPTLKNHARPIARYISKYMGKDSDFHYDKKENVIRYTIDWVDSEVIFYTSEREDSVRWESINLRVCDEAAFCSESIMYNSQATLASAKWWSYSITTVNPTTPKNHFYDTHIDYEISMNEPWSIYFATRVPISQNPFIEESEKAILAKEKHKNPRRYAAEYECEFQDGTGIDTSNFWIMDIEDAKREYQFADGRLFTLNIAWNLKDWWINAYLYYIISHDWASKKDQPWLTVWWYNNWKMDCVVAQYLKGLNYYDQVEVIDRLWKKLSWYGKGTPKDNNKAVRIIDYSWAGIALAEIYKRETGTLPVLVQWLGGVIENYESWTWRVGKDLMVNKFKWIMESWHIKWFSFMKEYKIEMEKYDDQWTRKNGNHQDIFASGIMAVRYGEKMWMLHKDQTTPQERFFDDEFSYLDNPPEYNTFIEDAVEDRYAMFGY
jgi:hypothetical protein